MDTTHARVSEPPILAYIAPIGLHHGTWELFFVLSKPGTNVARAWYLHMHIACQERKTVFEQREHVRTCLHCPTCGESWEIVGKGVHVSITDTM